MKGFKKVSNNPLLLYIVYKDTIRRVLIRCKHVWCDDFEIVVVVWHKKQCQLKYFLLSDIHSHRVLFYKDKDIDKYANS